ncbi:hypothetical protein H109_05265, partial [Trichophyton interdigitale MR816]
YISLSRRFACFPCLFSSPPFLDFFVVSTSGWLASFVLCELRHLLPNNTDLLFLLLASRSRGKEKTESLNSLQFRSSLHDQHLFCGSRSSLFYFSVNRVRQ